MRMRTARVLVALWFLHAAQAVTATSVRLVNIEDMVRLSGRIFHGHCVGVEEVTHRNGLPVLQYSFLVNRGLKGTDDGETVVFRQLQSSPARGFGVPGLPVFSKGQAVVLFLAPESRIGLTSAVGLAQGVFAVREDQPGQTLLVNGLRNQNLSHGLEAGRLRQMGLKRSHTKLLASHGPLALESLAEIVRTIDAFQRNKGAEAKR